MKRINRLLAEIDALKSGLHAEDLLLTWEKTAGELKPVMAVAEMLKFLRAKNIDPRVFEHGPGGFDLPRQIHAHALLFASAVNVLGLGLSELDEEKSQIAHGETVRETANMISFMTEASASATTCSWARGTPTCARSAGGAGGFREGRAASAAERHQFAVRRDHPTQALADLLL